MTKAFVSAVRLLARREHGAHELAVKLAKYSYTTLEIDDAIAHCQDLGLQSDARFVENMCRARIRQGYGPLRIRQDLLCVQIDSELIDDALARERDNWLQFALDVWEKKYKEHTDHSFAAQQKQKQFLLYRGFYMDTIHRVFKEL